MGTDRITRAGVRPVRWSSGWPAGARVAGALGAPGLIIGILSFLSFGFSLVVLLGEYHNPTQSGRSALHQVFASWIRESDYLGYNLVDRVERWQWATGADRARAKLLIHRAVADLGSRLNRDDARFRLIRLERLELGARGSSPLASWLPDPAPAPEETNQASSRDRIPVAASRGPGSPPVELTIDYRVVGPIAAAMERVESSYHRLVLALLGLSGYSLLCLGYMARHAQTQRERIAREAAAAATLDLADRTCHELGNVAFVVANERRNLAGHIDLLERFVAEDAAVFAQAVRQARISDEAANRLEQALRRAYADRGIDPEFELKGSAAIARDVCRQIAICSDYIALTVRELDGHLKRAGLPITFAAVGLDEILADALALLAPRVEAAAARVVQADPTMLAVKVQADRRLLIHAVVNLIKNALEAMPGDLDHPPSLEISVIRDQTTAALIIQDHGPGIAAAELPKIFEPGYSTKALGRGFGLAIVRESIAAQHGRLEVGSQLGVGTTVRITLPLAKPEA